MRLSTRHEGFALVTAATLAGLAGLRDGGPCHPIGLPEGYRTAARGQQLRMVGRRCASRGCPRTTARSGCARPTGWLSAYGL